MPNRPDLIAHRLFTQEESIEGRPRVKTIDSPILHRIQKVHFILYDVLPLFGTAFTLLFLFYHPITWLDMSLFAFMWIMTGLGISVGYHRLFTHCSFKTTPWVRALFGILGSMAAQGGVISWTAMHRRHHECGDRDGDLHSPNMSGEGFIGKIKGFVHAHFMWMSGHPYPNVVHYAPDLLKDPTIVWVNRNYNRWIALGFLIPMGVGGLVSQSWLGAFTGFLWGGVVRMFVVEQGIFSLNSLCHLVGSRRFKTKDKSRNIGLLAPFIFGESWHHNHHAFPASASFGLAWYRIDPGFWLIKALAIVRLAWDIKVPTAEQIRQRELPIS